MPDYPFLIGGVERRSGRLLPVINPYNGETIAQVHQAGADDVEDAVRAAAAAFKVTRKLPRYARADILFNLSRLIRERKEEIARLIAQEAGKALVDARGEVDRSILNCQGAAEEAKRITGEEIALDTDGSVAAYQNMVGTTDRQGTASTAGGGVGAAGAGRLAMAKRFPLGPILAITPFNFPLNLCLHKVAPAIAAGNSVVLKPPPQTPLTPLLLGRLLLEAGLPAGAISVVPTSNELASRLVADERLKMVTFTGSAKVGWHIKNQAGRKRVTLELGGNGGVIVDETCDLDYAVRRCVRGRFVYAGQYCIGVQRVFIQRSRYQAFVDKFVAEVDKLRVGDPLADGTDMGPVISADSAARIVGWVEEAAAKGARVLRGGKRQGAVVEPTVLVDTSPDMKVQCEEVFGPVISLHPYDTWEEALVMMNDSRYGLQGGVFTKDMSRALQAYEEIEVGGLMINDVPIYRIDNMPFGGVKESGFGREGTRYAIESMTELKLLVLNP